MNRFDLAKERVYDALWELCEYDDTAYQLACSGKSEEPIINDVLTLAAKLDSISQDVKLIQRHFQY